VWKGVGKEQISFLHQSSKGDHPARTKCYTDYTNLTTFRLAPYKTILYFQKFKVLEFLSLGAKIVLLGNNVAFEQRLFSQYMLCSEFNKTVDKRTNFLFKCVRNLWQG
jgi:hypothetical protein